MLTRPPSRRLVDERGSTTGLREPVAADERGRDDTVLTYSRSAVLRSIVRCKRVVRYIGRIPVLDTSGSVPQTSAEGRVWRISVRHTSSRLQRESRAP